VARSGVYVRDKGATKELTTKEEIRAYFPDQDLSHITITLEETDEVWTGNITHNLSRMAREVICSGGKNLRDLLWEPNENGYSIVTKDYINKVLECFNNLIDNRESLEKYNPANGWGNYDILLEFVHSYVQALLGIILDLDNDEYKIHASV
jgi:hypothetical protein